MVPETAASDATCSYSCQNKQSERWEKERIIHFMGSRAQHARTGKESKKAEQKKRASQ
jgi:hypothetical protein